VRGWLEFSFHTVTMTDSMCLVDRKQTARPSHHIAPTLKLTDDNNAAQLQLAFQRKAVQDFRTMRQAQQAEFLLNPSSPPNVASPTATSQPKRNQSASADADTEDSERDDGGVNEQPKSRTSSLVHLKPPQKSSLASHVAGKKRHITPSTVNVSQTKYITISDDDSDGGADADQVPVKRA
jgi:hypothetical protein